MQIVRRFQRHGRGQLLRARRRNRKPLWDTQLGGNIRGIPMSFAVDGKQYVAIAAGFALFVYGLP